MFIKCLSGKHTSILSMDHFSDVTKLFSHMFICCENCDSLQVFLKNVYHLLDLLTVVNILFYTVALLQVEGGSRNQMSYHECPKRKNVHGFISYLAGIFGSNHPRSENLELFIFRFHFNGITSQWCVNLIEENFKNSDSGLSISEFVSITGFQTIRSKRTHFTETDLISDHITLKQIYICITSNSIHHPPTVWLK